VIERVLGLRVRAAMACGAAALAGLALSAPALAGAPAKPKPKPAVTAPPPAELSEAAARVAGWVASSSDNGELPYIIVDKQAAELFMFDAKGKRLGDAPVLIGVAAGDEATPGIGSKKLAEIGPAERTTPAGRFIAKVGRAAGKQRVLWVDYHTSVALHAVVTTNKKERRGERLQSPTAEDNRITFGCINVPATFYSKNLSPLFQKAGGVVYVLPDSKPLEEIFPRLWVEPYRERPVEVSQAGG
jgi:hypothetical protein